MGVELAWIGRNGMRCTCNLLVLILDGQYINQSLTVFTGPMGAAWAPEVSDFRSEFGQWIGPSERVRGPDWGPLEPPKSEISGPRLDSRFAGRC